MKVALIDPSCFTGPYDMGLAEGLAGAGAEVRLFVGNVPAGDPLASRPGTVQHFYRGLDAIGAKRLPKPLFQALKGCAHIAGMARLIRAFQQWRPDIIHFQWTPLPVVDRRFLPALRQFGPLVLTVHDSMPFNGNPSARLQSVGAAAILEDFDALVVHTDQAMQRLGSVLADPSRLVRIAHGTLDRAPSAAEASRSMSGKDLADPDVELLLFGKIKPYKGLDVLIRALALVDPALRARCRIRVVGKPYMDMAQHFELAQSLGVADRFVFELRFVDTDEIPDLMRQASAAIFPYREIDASGVLMEALATGRPIIASALGNFVDLLADGEAGLLVPPGDPQALAAALTRFIADPTLRERLGAASLRVQGAVPTWPEVGRTTRQLYEGMLEAARRQALSDRSLPLEATSGGKQ